MWTLRLIFLAALVFPITAFSDCPESYKGMSWIVLIDADLLYEPQNAANPATSVSAGEQVKVLEQKLSADGVPYAFVQTARCYGPDAWRGWISPSKLTPLSSFEPLTLWGGPRRLQLLVGHCEFTHTFQANATVVSVTECDGGSRQTSRGRLYRKDSIILAKYGKSAMDIFVLRDPQKLCWAPDRNQCTK
jgi:hypothetical protein